MSENQTNQPISPVVIYTTSTCGFCHAAKRLLERKPVEFREINLSHEDPSVREELMSQTQHRTVPQIFINENFIGGYDQLYQLNQSGELDRMLIDETAHNQQKAQSKE